MLMKEMEYINKVNNFNKCDLRSSTIILRLGLVSWDFQMKV